jgi:cystathionine beta-lyase
MDLEAVENACKAGAKLMLLCNPHNPVGRAWKKEEMTALLELLKRYDVTLLSDEIHEDFVFEKDLSGALFLNGNQLKDFYEEVKANFAK